MGSKVGGRQREKGEVQQLSETRGKGRKAERGGDRETKQKGEGGKSSKPERGREKGSKEE